MYRQLFIVPIVAILTTSVSPMEAQQASTPPPVSLTNPQAITENGQTADYWTPERFLNAKPLEMTATVPVTRTPSRSTPASGAAVVGSDAQPPSVTIEPTLPNLLVAPSQTIDQQQSQP